MQPFSIKIIILNITLNILSLRLELDNTKTSEDMQSFFNNL